MGIYANVGCIYGTFPVPCPPSYRSFALKRQTDRENVLSQSTLKLQYE